MRDQQKAEDIAAKQKQLLSPLLADGLDAAKIREIRNNNYSRPAYPSVPCAAVSGKKNTAKTAT